MRNYMTIFIQFVRSAAILLIMLLIGRGISWLIPSIPEGIAGLLALFGALASGIVQKAWILPTARLLNRYMTIFLLPICVGIINYGDVLQQRFAQLVLANILSSLISLVIIAWLAHRFLAKGETL